MDKLEKDFLKRIDNFADRISQIDERFQNWLGSKVIRFAEDYSNGRLGIVLYLHRRGKPNNERVALCVDSCPGAIGYPTPIRTNQIKASVKADDVSSDKQHPVLIDIVEFVERPDQGSIPSIVRLYNVEDERLSLWEGLMYRRIVSFGVVDSGLKILPRFISWKGYLRSEMIIAGPGEARPQEIHNAIKTMNGIPQMEGQSCWDEILHSNGDSRGLRIIVDSDNIHVVCGDIINELFDSIDVAFGPFNLEF